MKKVILIPLGGQFSFTRMSGSKLNSIPKSVGGI